MNLASTTCAGQNVTLQRLTIINFKQDTINILSKLQRAIKNIIRLESDPAGQILNSPHKKIQEKFLNFEIKTSTLFQLEIK